MTTRCAFLFGCLLAGAGIGFAAVSVDTSASVNQGNAKQTVALALSTTSGNELLLAFISTDWLSGANTVVNGVTGGNLTWTLVVRANAQSGTSEIWRAFATAGLSNASITATLSQAVVSSMTVIALAGVDASGTNGSGAIGAAVSNSASSGAPTASLVTTRNNSWVFGVGNDFDNAIARTLGPNQVLIHQDLAPVGDTYWVQRQSAPTPTSGTTVTINDVSPTTDRYNLAIVEVVPAPSAGSTYTISGSVTPAINGLGATMTLTQKSSVVATVTADTSGNYVFSGISNGTYTVTPTKAGFTFSPASQGVTVSGANQTVPPFSATPIPTWSISGMVSPSTLGAGTLLTLSGTPGGTTTSDSSGSYRFTGLQNGSYTVTPSKSGYIFSPTNWPVNVSGGDVSGINFTAQSAPPPPLNYPDLSDIIPTTEISIVGSGSSRMFQYTHDTFNGGSGPLVIQPVYNQASGNYQGIQYIYSFNAGKWTLQQQVPVAGAFVFDAAHGHFHFPFSSYGLYAANADGSIGGPVALSTKTGFCIDDSFIYDPSLPNAGALGNLGSCSDPTSLRGLDIGAVDEYDQTDEGQSISIAGVPDGTYWLRAVVDPYNYLAESDKTNNETDVKLTIKGNTVQILQTVTPVLRLPPGITLSSPAEGTALTGTVVLAASTAVTTGVQFLVDGLPMGAVVTATPYTVAWDTTLVPNGTHWLAVQTTSAGGPIGTSAVVTVTVSNGASPPTVRVTDPDPGATLTASVALTATAADASGITSVRFYVDGLGIGSALTAPPYILYWNTATVADGTHVITASATDTAGLTATSLGVTVTVDNSHPANTIGKDVVVSVDGVNVMQTSPFSTTVQGEFLVAFVAYDGADGSPQTATVYGAGLNWVLLKRSNVQSGTAEIWAAQSDDPLTNVTVISQPGVGTTYHGSLTVIAFTNASGAGVVGQSSAPSGAPDIYLPGVTAGDWVFAVGNDWDNAIGRTPVAGQVLVHQRVDTQVGDTYWVQSTATPSTANALVDIHDQAPTSDQWNYAAVEIVATRQSP